MKIYLLVIALFNLSAWAQQTGVQNNKNEVDENLKKEKCKVIGINSTSNVGTTATPSQTKPAVKKN
jgi:hypothetical protein